MPGLPQHHKHHEIRQEQLKEGHLPVGPDGEDGLVIHVEEAEDVALEPGVDVLLGYLIIL